MNNSFTTMRLGLGALAILAGSTAALAEGPIGVASANPADGSSVISLKSITLTLENADPVFGTEWKYGVKASVTNAEGEEVTTAKGQDTAGGFKLNLTQEITEPGVYTINVPANTLYTMDWDTFEPIESTYNEAFSLTYTVVDMEAVVIGETTPPSGSVMTRLKQIPIEVTGGDPLFGLLWRNGAKGEIVNEEGEVMEAYAKIQNSYGYRLNLSKEITTPGTYTITIPSNALYAINEDWEEIVGSGNKQTILRYTIVDSPAMEFVSATPSVEEPVEALESVTIYWAGGDETVGYGVVEDAEITVTDANGEIVSYVGVASLDESATAYKLELETPVTENGTYTLVVPAGAFYALDGEGRRVYGNNSPAVALTYEVDNNVGVGAVEASVAAKEVYNLQGMRVNAAELPAGLYIINGKKVVVK